MMSYFTVVCWGCNKMETHPWHGPGPANDAIEKDMEERGWRRRAFWQSDWDKGPWFCSHECAHDSANAKYAEEYWQQKEFERYCREAQLPKVYFAIFGIVIAIVASLMYRGL